MHPIRFGILALVALSLVACSVVPGQSPSPVPNEMPAATPTEAPMEPVETPTAAPTEAPTETAAAATPGGNGVPYEDPNEYDYNYNYGPAGPDSTPSASEPLIGTAESAEHGTYLVDADGRALYVFASDHVGMSMCTGDCAESWPPLVVEEGATPTAASGVDGEFGTVARADGSRQLTYDDAPLYFFSGDSAPGDTNGHEVGDVWFLAQPRGGPARASRPRASTAAVVAAGGRA